jgi:hypothetical protein
MNDETKGLIVESLERFWKKRLRRRGPCPDPVFGARFGVGAGWDCKMDASGQGEQRQQPENSQEKTIQHLQSSLVSKVAMNRLDPVSATVRTAI